MHFRRSLGFSLLALSLAAPFASLAACEHAAAPGGGASPEARGRIRLVTTTSTDNSGLLRYLLPAFEERSGWRIDVVAVGTGKAIRLAERGDADLILVHARSREDAFVASGFGIDRRAIMWNDFVILGPPADPAAIRGASDAAGALRAVAATEAVFVSRGDDSGTHIRERALWERGGARPVWDGYLDAGQGMGACLVMADEKRGYVLADRGTFLALQARLDLVVLVEGDPRLTNPYGAIRVNPERHEGLNVEGAEALLDYLTSAEGQARIASFRIGGEVLFHPATDG